jgi:hypothetical protein
MIDTPCRLHIPLGRVENKTKEVAIGVAMSWHVFHNNLIPTEYAKVLVWDITGMGYTDYSTRPFHTWGSKRAWAGY